MLVADGTFFVGNRPAVGFWEAYCKSHQKIRTIDDLLNIPLEPTIKPVKCVIDPYEIPFTGLKDDKAQKAWILYNAYAPKGDSTTYSPTLDTFGKKLRWKLYTTLVKLRII